MKHHLTRRQFVTRSATAFAAAAFPVILSSSCAPATKRKARRRLAPSDKIQLACIGVGGMGTGNMKNFLALDGCRVVAVCDTYEEKSAKAKSLVDQAYGDTACATSGDFREILAREDVDAVMIATQDHWHALIATAAAAAGKDMYCEKPTGVSIEESQKIFNAVREAGCVFQAGTWQRSKGPFRHACELARNGYVGKIHTIQVSAPGPQYQPKYDGPMDPQPVPAGFNWNMWRGPAPDKPFNPGRVAWPDWYLIWDYCAGFICNWGVHHLDIAHWGCPRIGAEPFDVECKGVYRKKGFTDNIEGWDATFTFADGLKMIFTDPGKQKTGTKFIGDKGWVHVDRSGIWAEPESLLKVEMKDGEQRLHASDQHQDDFLSSVRSRKDPVADIHAVHVASSLGLIAEIAARVETKLKWDPKEERFIGNEEANKRLTRPMHNGWKL